MVEVQGMSIENLAQYFGTIEDPHRSGKVEHRWLGALHQVATALAHPVSRKTCWCGSGRGWSTPCVVMRQSSASLPRKALPSSIRC